MTTSEQHAFILYILVVIIGFLLVKNQLKSKFFQLLKREKSHVTQKAYGQKSNTLVSGNADDEKNLHPGGRKKNFFISLIEFLK